MWHVKLSRSQILEGKQWPIVHRYRTFHLIKIRGSQRPVGFIPSCQAGDNVRRACLLIHAARKRQIPTILLSLDYKKAFHSLSWNHLYHVLNMWGFGPTFQKWIAALYSNPSASVKYASYKSHIFPILRGTRQGCPLSPLLFALAIEPLAQLIRNDPSISGISQTITIKLVSLLMTFFCLSPTHILPCPS